MGGVGGGGVGLTAERAGVGGGLPCGRRSQGEVVSSRGRSWRIRSSYKTWFQDLRPCDTTSGCPGLNRTRLSMLTARARHAMARWWRRCAGGGPCMRVPWGEGNGDGGVGARGSCQGGGCTAPRPCPGFPLSRERRWGRWREGFVSGWGMHRPAPLPWIPAFAGTTMGALARGARVRVGDAPPRAPALDSRFRGNDDGGVGARGSCQGGGCTAPRPCPGFPLSRERRWGRWREGFVSGWGMHRPSPLPWIPAFAGTTMGECGFGERACRDVAGSGDGKAALRTGPSRASGQA